MTVPTQRGTSNEDPTVLSLILGAVEDVKSGMAHVTSKIDGLDQKFMPRAEYEARHSDLRNVVTQLEGRLQAEGKEREKLADQLTSAQERLQDQVTASRRFGWTTAIAAVVAVITLVALILSLYHT